MFMCVHICVWVYLPVCEHMCRRQRLVLGELLHCFSLLLLKIYLLLFMHMCVCFSEFMYHMCDVIHVMRPWNALELELQAVVSCLMQCWEPNLGPLWELYTCFTDESTLCPLAALLFAVGSLTASGVPATGSCLSPPTPELSYRHVPSPLAFVWLWGSKLRLPCLCTASASPT